MDIEKLLQNGQQAIKDLGRLWGQRPFQRKTFGTPPRTKSMAAFWAIDKFDKELNAGLFNVFLAHAWAGEDAYDTEALNRAIRATAQTVHEHNDSKNQQKE